MQLDPITNVAKDARILIVDDLETNIGALSQVLGRAGYAICISITDPAEALEKFVDIQPDLLLLDWHMEPFSGLEFIEALKSRIAADDMPPVLVLSADGSAETRRIRGAAAHPQPAPDTAAPPPAPGRAPGVGNPGDRTHERAGANAGGIALRARNDWQGAGSVGGGVEGRSGLYLQFHGLCQGALPGVEGKKFFRAQFERGRNVEDVEAAMAVLAGVPRGELLGCADHFCPIDGRDLQKAARKVALQIRQHPGTLPFAVALVRVFVMQERLPADGLPELEKQEGRHRERVRELVEKSVRLFRVVLLAIQSTQE
jgi:CheY-like chemotaxis protein